MRRARVGQTLAAARLTSSGTMLIGVGPPQPVLHTQPLTGTSSTSTLTKMMFGCLSLSSSKWGATILQGPHQVALKSTIICVHTGSSKAGHVAGHIGQNSCCHSAAHLDSGDSQLPDAKWRYSASSSSCILHCMKQHDSRPARVHALAATLGIYTMKELWGMIVRPDFYMYATLVLSVMYSCSNGQAW